MACLRGVDEHESKHASANVIRFVSGFWLIQSSFRRHMMTLELSAITRDQAAVKKHHLCLALRLMKHESFGNVVVSYFKRIRTNSRVKQAMHMKNKQKNLAPVFFASGSEFVLG